jgi:uncharacterized protein with ATP-grasp and redox domains
MANRYIVKTKITSVDSNDTEFKVFANKAASEIMSEYYTSGKVNVLQDIIESDHRMIWHSFENEETYIEIREKLNNLGNYYNPGIAVEILSKGYN